MLTGSDLNTNAWVIKIGGSLYDSKFLAECLASIDKIFNKKVIIVPGGGPFADQVRLADKKFNLTSEHSHNMAILAMQQYGYLLNSMSSESVLADSIDKIYQTCVTSKVVIWEPYLMVRDQCSLDKTWDVTSDSLAAWLAHMLGVKNLLLIKSSKRVLETSDLKELANHDCVDLGLQELVDHYQINAVVMHKSKSNVLSEWLSSV